MNRQGTRYRICEMGDCLEFVNPGRKALGCLAPCMLPKAARSAAYRQHGDCAHAGQAGTSLPGV